MMKKSGFLAAALASLAMAMAPQMALARTVPGRPLCTAGQCMSSVLSRRAAV